MSNDFFKFPSTPHLTTLGGSEIRGDKVYSESERTDFLRHELVIEEKVDGANLGISFDSNGNLILQNRGSILKRKAEGQWKKLDQWLCPKIDSLFEILADQYILFGEWCYAQHSVFYSCLPNWFLGFDLYDKQAKKFLSVKRRDQLIMKMRIHSVPKLGQGVYSLPEIEGFLGQSKLSNEPAEGLYLRVDQDGWLKIRAKLVRASFIQSVDEHWSRSALKPNKIDLKTRETCSD